MTAGLRRSVASLSALTLLVAFVGLGCGGQDEERLSPAQYEREVAAATERFARDARRKAGDLTGAEPLPEQGRTLARVLEAMRVWMRDLEALKAPREIAAAHRDVIAGFRAYVRIRQPVVDAMLRGDEPTAERLMRTTPEFAAIARRLARAGQRFRARGYEFPVDKVAATGPG